MRFGSVCSGIDAASVAWAPLGWKAAFFSEIEAFPSAVLAHHYPDVPNLGDMTQFQEWPDATIDLLVGGTPCQSFSVAGLRQGLADPRGNLALTYLGIADRYRPKWFLWENVPGALSIDGGRAFGAILGALAKLGYGFAYRVLDAQFVRVDGFGWAVPQRRRRVFVVGYLGDWRRAAAVLFEPESLSRDHPPCREARQDVAGTVAGGARCRGGYSADDIPLTAFGGNRTSGPIDVAAALSAHGGPYGRCSFESETFVAHALRGEGFDASEDGTGRGTPIVPIPFDTTQICHPENRSNPKPGDACHGLAAGAHAPAIAFNPQAGGKQTSLGFNPKAGISGTLECNQIPAITHGWAVRRLTPTECERLQGFPDGYTDIPYRGKPAADGPRYKALGNSMAVNVMRWIGRRIEMVEGITDEIQREAAE